MRNGCRYSIIVVNLPIKPLINLLNMRIIFSYFNLTKLNLLNIIAIYSTICKYSDQYKSSQAKYYIILQHC